PAKPAFETSQSHRAASCRRYSSSSPPVSAPPPRYRRESSPMAPVDRLPRADRLSQTVPPAARPHQRTPVAPSWPPRIIAVTSEIRTGQRQELLFEAPIIRVPIDHPPENVDVVVQPAARAIHSVTRWPASRSKALLAMATPRANGTNQSGKPILRRSISSAMRCGGGSFRKVCHSESETSRWSTPPHITRSIHFSLASPILVLAGARARAA